MIALLLFVTDRVRGKGENMQSVVSVCPSVCFHSYLFEVTFELEF